MTNNQTSERSFLLGYFGGAKYVLPLLLAVLLLLGIGIRLLDLTDPPLGFNPSRQLRGAIIARGIYYQLLPDADLAEREFAVAMQNSMREYEPTILEGMVAGVYRLAGGEYFWVARIFNTTFWLVGGWFLFLLARRAGSLDGALVALAFYLFLPFGVLASRAFQPDPLMVMWIVLSVYAAYRWGEAQSWKWAILAGLFGGAAALVKIVAAYLIGAMIVAVVLSVLGLGKALKNAQVWAMGGLMVLPAFVHYVWLQGEGASTYFSTWGIALVPLVLNPSFYFQWIDRVDSLISIVLVCAGLVGVLLSGSLLRAMLLGLWVGYGLYGLTLPHQIVTHDYYHIQLIPIVALSLVPVVGLLFERMEQERKVWQSAFVALFVVLAAFPLWAARSALLGQDYRHEPSYWAAIGEQLPEQGSMIALTQQYGYPLAYYGWAKMDLWPVTQELRLSALRAAEKEFEDLFVYRVEGHEFFVVTAFSQLDKQQNLKQKLYNDYPVYAEGPGYIVFDLRQPAETP